MTENSGFEVRRRDGRKASGGEEEGDIGVAAPCGLCFTPASKDRSPGTPIRVPIRFVPQRAVMARAAGRTSYDGLLRRCEMPMDGVDRRSFLKTMGSASLYPALPVSAFAASPFVGSMVHEIVQPAQGAGVKPADSARFAVAGMSHDHIYGMVDAMTTDERNS